MNGLLLDLLSMLKDMYFNRSLKLSLFVFEITVKSPLALAMPKYGRDTIS